MEFKQLFLKATGAKICPECRNIKFGPVEVRCIQAFEKCGDCVKDQIDKEDRKIMKGEKHG